MTANERLAEIKARAGAATEGPWLDGGQGWVFGRAPTGNPDSMFDDLVASTSNFGDSQFIAASRTDVPALVAALEAVLELHQPFEWSFGFGPVQSCKHCAEQGANEEKAHYPCPTVEAITAALGVDQ